MFKRNVLVAVAAIGLMSVASISRADHVQFVGGHEPARMFQPTPINSDAHVPYALTGSDSASRSQIQTVQVGSRILVTGVARN